MLSTSLSPPVRSGSVNVDTYTYIYIYTHIYTCIQIYLYISTYLYAHTNCQSTLMARADFRVHLTVYLYVYICVYMYILSPTHTNCQGTLMAWADFRVHLKEESWDAEYALWKALFERSKILLTTGKSFFSVECVLLTTRAPCLSAEPRVGVGVGVGVLWVYVSVCLRACEGLV